MGFEVIFLHGPPAAGKRTIGALLAARTGLPLFHNHLTVDLAASLFPFGDPEFARLRAEVWLAAFRAAARAQRSFIFTFNPEASVAPETVHEMAEIVRSSGGDVRYVELRCDERSILDRLGNADRAAFGKLIDRALYARIRASGGFDFPALPEPALIIDTDAVSPEGAVDVIVARLG